MGIISRRTPLPILRDALCYSFAAVLLPVATMRLPNDGYYTIILQK